MRRIWTLNAKRIMASDLRSHLEKERDHYAATALVAGPDPRGKSYPVIHFDGWETVVAHMTEGIEDAMAVANTKPAVPLHVTVHGRLNTRPGETDVGNVMRVDITIAEKVEPAPFGEGDDPLPIPQGEGAAGA